MKITWVDGEVKPAVECLMAQWLEAGEDVEAHMKEMGWEVMPIDVSDTKMGDLLDSALELIELGVRLQAEGVETLTLMYTDIDETLWGRRS